MAVPHALYHFIFYDSTYFSKFTQWADNDHLETPLQIKSFFFNDAELNALLNIVKVEFLETSRNSGHCPILLVAFGAGDADALTCTSTFHPISTLISQAK